MVADLAWQIQLEDAHVWQRERTLLTVEVRSTERFASLEASLPRIAGVDVQALPAINEAGTDGKRVLRLVWQLSAHTPGKQTITLPVIRYNLNGRDAAQWQPPPQTLEVQALPPYLPPTTPVGKVAIESRLEPSGWLQPGYLAYWHISLSSDAVNTAQFPPLLRQMQSSGVELFPAKVEKATRDDGRYRLDYRIPFKPQNSGKLDLPTLHWHWFDPDTGRLEQVQYEPPRPWVLGWVWRGVLGLSSALVLLASLWFAVKKGKRQWRQWHSKRQVLQALQGEVDVATVGQALRDCALAHGWPWPENMSTRQWLRHWQQRYGEDANLFTQVQAWEARRYGKTPAVR